MVNKTSSSIIILHKKNNLYLCIVLLTVFIFGLALLPFSKNINNSYKVYMALLLIFDIVSILFIFLSKYIKYNIKKYLYIIVGYASVPFSVYLQSGTIDNTYLGFLALVTASLYADYAYLLFVTAISLFVNEAMYIISSSEFFPVFNQEQFYSYMFCLFIAGLILSFGVKAIVTYIGHNEELKLLNKKVEKALSDLKKAQEKLIHKDRLSGLGQMIGGIAHNLKTPIMSISGPLVALNDLIDEYNVSINDPNVEKSDHFAIAADMKEWLRKIYPHLEYMTDIIDTVKEQATQLNTNELISDSAFSIEDLINRINLLMSHSIKASKCKLNIKNEIHEDIKVKGEIVTLLQVINNLIQNSIHAYNDQTGEIDLIINQEEKFIELCVKDYGSGIPDFVKYKIFNQMITSKGKNGTGMGLYMSYSAIKGKFGGDMRFESSDQGTSFYVILPTASM
ncbi:sensor histidine kinase [Pseudobacteroides cellulosolvens]|uniref:histidine kinase n=1 Tax=Pseudobacteroides cellulosolvens ATCC 35603 = DSM 2933 TaxID=398512 RepID=A0A0L6JR81_9FIRM|nr:HAMP domain-containing sensor histidine kinase [Pseudobacteroides cellulosolvens]KNY27892.1 integral membrane sensor signal transduction histidine kinase [Pseudobacteroides cellulosolvens ATCC 35603 = DSM 2933]